MPISDWTTFWRKRLDVKQAFSGSRGAATADGGAGMCDTASLGCTLGIGHSHIMSLVYAQRARVEIAQPVATHMHWVLLQDEEFEPNVMEYRGRAVLNPVLRRRIDRELASLRDAPPFLCVSVSGNEYFYLGFTEHPRRFDFSLPERPDLQVRSGVEIIPPSLLRKTLEHSIDNALSIMTALREAIGIPIVFIQSPPPLFSNDFIRNSAGPFRDAIEENGLAPASVRMKFWLVQSSIYCEKCKQLGWRYLEVPPEAVDASGFLQERAAWPDSVHANAWYGELMLRRIESLFRESSVGVSR